MSYAAIASAVIGVAGTAYSSSQQKKAAGQSGARLDEAIAYARRHPEAFGNKPDEWNSLDYVPLFRSDPGYAGLAGDAIAGNRANFGAAAMLSTANNEWALADEQARIAAWDPTFEDSFAIQQRNTQNLLNGILPYEDIQGVAANRSEINSILGGSGNGQQTAADLGLRRIDLMRQGEQSLNANEGLISRLSPFARRTTPQSMFVNPQDVISSAVGENWQDYQAAAQERDAAFAFEAMADPYQQGLLNLLSGQAGIAAGASPVGGGTNWAQIAQMAGGAINAYQNRNTAQNTGGGAGTSAWGTGYTGGATHNLSNTTTPTSAYNQPYQQV